MDTATAQALVDRAFARSIRPDPILSVSQWADSHRMLSAKSSSEKGPWRTSRTPYLREIMDRLSANDPCRRVVFMKGAQIGATEAGNNWLGYIIHHAPAPILMVYPTVEVAKRVSRQRVSAMIADTPALRAAVQESKSRDSANTTFLKEFNGGILILTGSNSGSGLRSMPISRLYLDECDEYPDDVDGQGDPVAIAEERGATFGSRVKVFLPSTPTIKDLSRIEEEFNRTDRRRFYLPCPMCGHMDFLTWNGQDLVTEIEGIHYRIEWEEGRPSTACAVCPNCEAKIPEHHKDQMLAAGEWRPTREADEPHVHGYHLSGLYSPLGWRSWTECVRKWLRSKREPRRLKVWINTIAGETWEEKGFGLRPKTLMDRRETWTGEVPHGVGVVIASVDVQGDRLEVLLTGFGHAEESWTLGWEQIYGDPGRERVWHELHEFLGKRLEHASGQKVPITLTTIDSQGEHTEMVYRFCKAHEDALVFAVRGGNEIGKPVVSQPTRNNRYRAKLFTLCVDTAKDLIYSRLQIESAGPGFIHLGAWCDQEFIEQLTAEKAIRKYVPRKGSIKQWVKIRERNEVLDLTVYAMAGLYIGGAALVHSLQERAARLSKPPDGGPDSGTPAPPTPAPRAPRNFATGWRR